MRGETGGSNGEGERERGRERTSKAEKGRKEGVRLEIG